MNKIAVLNLLFVLFLNQTFSQKNETIPVNLINGYVKTIKGGDFSYHSPFPDVNSSLLIRANSNKDEIVWESGLIPSDFKEKTANFIWIFGIDANTDSHQYTLYLNDKQCIVFSNPVLDKIKNWSVKGENGAILQFVPTILDRFGDPMGYAILSVPVSLLKLGKEQEFKIKGIDAQSNSWYMTFKSEVKETIKLSQQEALINENGKRYQPLILSITYFGTATTGKIDIPGKLNKTFTLKAGYNEFRYQLPAVINPVHLTAEVTVGKKQSTKHLLTMNPVQHRTIYFAQHAHTDIGYTRPQTEILPEHLRYIDFALDYCDQTDKYPDNAKFRWTCESSWAVREYLNTRPQSQIDRLLKRIKEGRIEVTGLFFNMSEVFDEVSLIDILKPVKQFKDLDIPVKTAMQNDVNGLGWSLIDNLKSIGIQYVTMGENTDRALKPFDNPTVFWWQSKSGNKILAYRAEHYMTGNFIGILSSNLTTLENGLFKHLNDIYSKGYPFSYYSIQFSGYHTDNSPPSTTACDLVKQWNKKYEWPKIRLSTISEFLDKIKEDNSTDISVYQAAWPDWWSDGFGSACLETSQSRLTQSDFIATRGLLAMTSLLGTKISTNTQNNIQSIIDALAFYNEHTFGAAESISDPLVENSIVQWGEKAAYVWDAVKRNRMLREEGMGLFQNYLLKTDVPSLVVFNTLGWERSGMCEVYIDNQIIPKGHEFSIVDDQGNTIVAQSVRSREEGTYWVFSIDNLPAFGYKTYRIEVKKEIINNIQHFKFDGKLNGLFYDIEIDTVKGAITSLFDKELNIEMLDKKSEWKLGQFIYERLGNNRNQLSQLKLEEFSRTSWENIRIVKAAEGPIWKSVFLSGKNAECAGNNEISCEIRLYKNQKLLELHYAMKKLAVYMPEGVYIAFPFAHANGEINFEVPGGSIVPGKGQLEGTSSDWNAVQSYVSIKNKHSQILFSSPEIPLVQFSEINLGKFERMANHSRPHIYSWVLNNYWTTNFRASQEGELKWKYQISSVANSNEAIGGQFGWNSRIPLLTRVLPASSTKTPCVSKSFLNFSSNILLTHAKPSLYNQGIVINLREISGKNSEFNLDKILIDNKLKRIVEVNALEDIIGNEISKISFKPYEVKFIRLEME